MTICDERHDKLRPFTTICDNLRLLRQPPSLCSIDIKRHKTSYVIIKCHETSCDNLRQFATIYDALQDALIDTVRQLLGQPTITADQLHLAKLPVTAGGLGLPHLPTLALVARASCIATLPRAVHTDSFRRHLVRQEGDLMLNRLLRPQRKTPSTDGRRPPGCSSRIQPSPPQSQTHQIYPLHSGERLVEAKS